MSWGKEWPVPAIVFIDPINDLVSRTIIDSNKETVTIREVYKTGKAIAEPVFLTKEEFQKIYPSNTYGKFSSDTKVYQNKVPTHDPYTNPDAHIYYQCNCGAVLDPGTKSFAALNNAAMVSGWKVRWGVECYKCYCVECGEGVE